MSDQTGIVTLKLDAEAAQVVLAALDLAQRVAMGQWREVVDHSAHLFNDGDAGLFGPIGTELVGVRCTHAVDPHLHHPNASLPIARTPRPAQVASDVWRALGGGVLWGGDDRLTDAHVVVTPDPRAERSGQ